MTQRIAAPAIRVDSDMSVHRVEVLGEDERRGSDRSWRRSYSSAGERRSIGEFVHGVYRHGL